MKLAAAYLRRSTDDKQADSIDIQKAEVEKYAEKNEYKIVAWYVDDGISGHDEDRSDFVRMINDCESGKSFDYILVRHQSRFGRFRPATTIAYLDRIDRHGVRLVTTKQGIIDIDNLSEYLMASIEAETDHKFSRTLSELTIRGQAQTASKGRSAGQLAPYGMDRVLVDENGQHRQRVKNGEKYAKPDTWTVSFIPSDNDEHVDTVRWIFETYVYSRKGYHSIATELNKRGIPAVRGGQWNQGTIRDLLKNPIYCGDYRWNKRRQGKFSSRIGGDTRNRPADPKSPNKKRKPVARRKKAVILNDESDWIVVLNSHEGIISRELWQKAQDIMMENGHSAGKPPVDDHAYLLKGMVVCSHCGEKMHGAKRTKRKGGKTYITHRYVCSGYSCKGICEHHAVNADELHQIIVREIVAKFQNPETIDAIYEAAKSMAKTESPEQSSEVDRLRRQLEQTSKKLETATSRVATVPDHLLQNVFNEMTKLKDQQSRLEAELADATKSVQSEPEEITKAEIEAALTSFTNDISHCPPDKLRDVLAHTVERIELEFRDEPYGKRTIRRLAGGMIHLQKSSEFLVAGTGFEPATSRL